MPYQVFQGNSDRDTIVRHAIDPVIKARFIRVRPVTWHIHVSMRMELYGCYGNSMIHIRVNCVVITVISVVYQLFY